MIKRCQSPFYHFLLAARRSSLPDKKVSDTFLSFSRLREEEPNITTMTATALRKDLYNAIERVNEDCVPIYIASSRGKGAVLIGEDDWASIEETLYLQSIPGITAKRVSISRMWNGSRLDINLAKQTAKELRLIRAARFRNRMRALD